MAGLSPTREQVDEVLGFALRDLNMAINKVAELRQWVNTTSDQDLLDLGWSTDEVAIIKSAFDDMDQFVKIYKGNQPLTAAKDFRTFIKRMWGLGVV